MSGGSLARPTVAVPEDQVVRYTYAERINHWMSAISYGYCLVSGFALFTPYLFWMAAVLGGGATVRYWHPWLGLVYAATVLQMHRFWQRDLVISDADRKWSKNITDYVTNQDDKIPAQDRFNAGQKQFYWVMFYAMFVLLLTGVVMWFPEKMPRNLHWVLTVCVFIHSATALLSIAGFMIHVYMSIWVTPGSAKGMIEGKVSTAWAKSHHRLWYEKITGRKS